MAESCENSGEIFLIGPDVAVSFGFSEDFGGAFRQPTGDHEFFTHSRERVELFKFTRMTAEYAQEHEITAIVLLDRSARPLATGLREYWRGTQEGSETNPAIFFVNFEGFNQDGDVPSRLDVEHPFLAQHKEGKVLIVDTCIHRGEAIRPVIDGLNESGFKDVRFAVASDYENISGVTPDLIMQSIWPMAGCYPFEREELVEKGDRLYSDSLAGSKYLVERGRRQRHEIKRIIQEGLSGQHNEVVIKDYDEDETRLSLNEIRKGEGRRAARSGAITGAIGGAITGELINLLTGASVDESLVRIVLTSTWTSAITSFFARHVKKQR